MADPSLLEDCRLARERLAREIKITSETVKRARERCDEAVSQSRQHLSIPNHRDRNAAPPAIES